MTAQEIPTEVLGVGIHEIPVREYHNDPAPEVSLSHSGIVTLLSETPAHFMARHPRLSPWPIKDEPTDAQKLGAIVHRLILGRGDDYCVIDLANFTNKDGKPAQTFNNADAKRAKQDAEGRGLIVIDKDLNGAAQTIAQKGIDALRARFGDWPIGESEQTMLWKRQTDHGEIWGRELADHFSLKAATILDVKTTGRGVSNEEIAKKIASDGDDIQAAWYLEGAAAVFPKLAGLLQFMFVFVEVEPPYQVRFVKLSESWLTRARFRIDRAANTFAKCLAAKSWPGYEGGTAVLSAPGWMEAKWTEEELQEAE